MLKNYTKSRYSCKKLVVDFIQAPYRHHSYFLSLPFSFCNLYVMIKLGLESYHSEFK